MLKFVRILSVLYLFCFIYFSLVMFFDEPFRSMNLPLGPVIYIVYLLLPVCSLILLLNPKKYSPDFVFRHRTGAIAGHILFFVLSASLVSGNLGFLPSDSIISKLVIFIIALIPLINFVSIFEYKFLNKK